MKNDFSQKIFFFITSLLLASLVKKPIILCFHRVKAPSKSLLDRRVGLTNPGIFKKVLRSMEIMGYQFVPLDELVNMLKANEYKKVAAVTFDDGFKDLYQNAYPVLKAFNIPYTLFLITSLMDSDKLLWLHKLYLSLDRLPLEKKKEILGRHENEPFNTEDIPFSIGKIIHSQAMEDIKSIVESASSASKIDKQEEREMAGELYLSKGELGEMRNNGLTIEAHGHEHWPLTNLNKEETEEEIISSIRFIEEELGGRPKYFSLPYGTSNKYTEDIIKTAGLKGITTIKSQIITEDSANLYDLPRICVYDDTAGFYKIIGKYCLKYIQMKYFKALR